MDRKSAIMSYIQKDILRGRGGSLDANADLLGAGIIDSLGILQLVAFIDDQFGIQVPDEDVVIENFQSVNALASYLERFN
jgi:acyl carrier protein